MHALAESQQPRENQTGDSANKKEDQDSVQPNNSCYVTVLRGWSKVPPHKARDAPVRAQALMDDMLTRYNNGDSGMAPNRLVYNYVLTVWVNHAGPHHLDAGRRALAILNEMQDWYERDPQNHDPPEHHHYNDVLGAFACVGDVDNAERVFERMLQEYQKQESSQQLQPQDGSNRTKKRPSLRPTHVSVNRLLNAYAQSSSPDLTRAKQLLQSMRELTGSAPDVVTYSTYLTCWQRSHHEDTYVTVKSIVQEMMASKTRSVAPNAHTFGSLLTTLHHAFRGSWEEQQREADEVEAWMKQMQLAPTSNLRTMLQQIRQPPRVPPADTHNR